MQLNNQIAYTAKYTDRNGEEREDLIFADTRQEAKAMLDQAEKGAKLHSIRISWPDKAK